MIWLVLGAVIGVLKVLHANHHGMDKQVDDAMCCMHEVHFPACLLAVILIQANRKVSCACRPWLALHANPDYSLAVHNCVYLVWILQELTYT